MSLASRYRPQTFADVVGQNLATTALSRAAAENRAAPAYLLSGTRGVGKTTIARIFAKALNCEHGPAGEPCNACGACQRVTNGTHVDVMEIDGASNTSVEDVRVLRENIGFAPMEGRYKVFIIDEAHMLSKSAFNALLKTLEEPPPRAVFIFATTEAHKFPPTIISRCQHFVFRHLPEDLIFQHLCKILKLENMEFEEDAVHLVARRAQGSARDSLSLMDQILALGPSVLNVAITREALGLAGQEFFAELFPALKAGSLAKILELSRQLLRAGVDIGFFLREFATNLRNLFLFSQAGEPILASLEVSRDEAEFIKRNAAFFTSSHLHAAWQMALEAQRGINMSPEPGAALELLLLNLAMLPRLLPVGDVPSPPAGQAQAAPQSFSLEENVKKNTDFHVPPEIPDPPRKAEEESLSHGEVEAAREKSKWEQFAEFCATGRAEGREMPSADFFAGIKAVWHGNKLELRPESVMLMERFEKAKALFNSALGEFCKGAQPDLEIFAPDAPASKDELMSKLNETPEMRLCQDILGAEIVDYRKNGH